MTFFYFCKRIDNFFGIAFYCYDIVSGSSLNKADMHIPSEYDYVSAQSFLFTDPFIVFICISGIARYISKRSELLCYCDLVIETCFVVAPRNKSSAPRSTVCISELRFVIPYPIRPSSDSIFRVLHVWLIKDVGRLPMQRIRIAAV